MSTHRPTPATAPGTPPSLLLSTPHGSHLYGLAHADSDRDTYRVVPQNPTAAKSKQMTQTMTQTPTGLDDTVTAGLSTWLLLCEAGNPQALEAMFSLQATVDVLAGYRAAYRVNRHTLRATYTRTACKIGRPRAA